MIVRGNNIWILFVLQNWKENFLVGVGILCFLLRMGNIGYNLNTPTTTTIYIVHKPGLFVKTAYFTYRLMGYKRPYQLGKLPILFKVL